MASVKYEDIPAAAVAATKRCILDVLGTIIAASTVGSGCREIVGIVREWGGKEESTILSFGGRVPSASAAFANGAMAHLLDFDDFHGDAHVHPSISTIPAALAIAERVGPVNGKDFITAVTLGTDMVCRLGLSVTRRPRGRQHDWLLTPVLGVFSAAATCGRLLGLTREQIMDAMGIAFLQAAGTMEIADSVGAIVRGMYGGFIGKTGVLSALMAQKGVTGTRTCLEGNAGLYQIYFGGEFDRASLVGELGKRFEGANVGFKPWPSCRQTHQYIDATLGIMKKHALQPDSIVEITAHVGKHTVHLCQPLEGRRRPATTMDAKWSIPFTVGTAIARGRVGIGNFTLEGIKDPASLQLAAKVTPVQDPQFDPLNTGMITIMAGGGKRYSERVDLAYGHPEKPVSAEDLKAKFRDCASFSATPLPNANVERVIELVEGLEEVGDIGNVTRLLAGRQAS